MGRLLVLFLVAGCGKELAQQMEGRQLFAAVCARCHGADGSGGAKVATGQAPRNLRERAFQDRVTDGDLRRVLIEGKPPGMPAFGTTFKPEQLDALVTHVRTLSPGR